jgi:hypothetical protein
MAKDDAKDPKGKGENPSLTQGSTNVTIAFPFSNIKSEQPNEQLSELAGIVGALAEELAEFRPTPRTRVLAELAQELVARLGK